MSLVFQILQQIKLIRRDLATTSTLKVQTNPNEEENKVITDAYNLSPGNNLSKEKTQSHKNEYILVVQSGNIDAYSN